MNFSNIGFTEILIVLLVFVLLFGARRIPEIGASIGKGIKEFKNSLREVNDADDTRPLSPPGPAAPLTKDAEREPKRLGQ
jgi:sec-independent protein translocase protein TatA